MEDNTKDLYVEAARLTMASLIKQVKSVLSEDAQKKVDHAMACHQQQVRLVLDRNGRGQFEQSPNESAEMHSPAFA